MRAKRTSSSAPRLNDALVIDVLTAIYRTDGSYEEWRRNIMQAILDLHPRARTATWFEYDWHFESNGLSLDRLYSTEVIGEDAAVETWLRAREKVPAPLRSRLFGRSWAATASQASSLGEQTRFSPAWPELWRDSIVDSFGIVGADPAGEGVCASVGLLELRSLSVRELRLLERLAVHLLAGHRLRRDAKPRFVEDAEAILSPAGNVLHATKSAKNKLVSLQEGRRRRDVAKSTTHDSDTALEIWQGLAAGRWSLVDHLDTDGKRLLLAMRNAPQVDAFLDLSPRERRVCALVAMGHRDKEISYLLGLSLASVTASLHRARTKLNVATRGALAARWRRGS